MKLKRDIIFYNPTWKNDKTIYDYIRIHNIEMVSLSFATGACNQVGH